MSASKRREGKRLRRGLACAALAVAAVMASPAGAFAWDASISGHVTNEAGVPLQDAVVVLQLPAVGFEASVSTDASGAYSFSGLDDGAYKVWFQPGGAGNYADEWWNNRPGGLDGSDTVVLATGQHRTGIDAQLAIGATISGRVTNAAGDAIPGVCVFWDSASHIPPRGYNLEFTDQWGNYTLKFMRAGTGYEVSYAPDCNGPSNYLPEVYDNDHDGRADILTPGVGGLTGIDAQLEAITPLAPESVAFPPAPVQTTRPRACRTVRRVHIHRRVHVYQRGGKRIRHIRRTRHIHRIRRCT